MIFVDSREIPSDILRILEGMRLPYEVKTLLVGDFIITGVNGMVLVERKTAGDYIASLKDARLNNQLVQMSHSYHHTVLLIEGSINRAALESGINRNAVYSSLVGSFIRHSMDGAKGAVSLFMVENQWDVGLVLKFIQSKMDDPEGLVRLPILTTPTVGDDEDTYLKMLCCIPNIGENTGSEIKKHFPTMELLVRASPEELEAKCRGVGKTTANTIYDSLRGRR